MARILAIETATKVCSVALSDNGSIIAESALHVPQVHVERLVICANEMMGNVHLNYADLDAVAVSNGPGSFTGLRIGLSVAKGIVFALDKKLLAVPTLDAMALRARDFAGGRVVVPLLHARAEEYFYGSFRIDASRAIKLGDYAIAEAEEIVDKFDMGTLFVGEGVGTILSNDAVVRKFGSESMRVLDASAREVAMLAVDRFNRGEFSDLRSLAPLYIKDFVAIKGNPLSKLSREIPAGGSSDGARQASGVEKS
jgi:tRNA threonylcarbamoyladenosine biosynthesis protein TsaB